MGVFTYTCEHCGDCAEQERHGSGRVYIEVPLKNGTNVILKGVYNLYGSVEVELKDKLYTFNDIQFSEFFEDWDDCEDAFISTKIWCRRCLPDCYKSTKKVDPTQFIKVFDHLPELKEARIASLSYRIHNFKESITELELQLKKLNG